MRRENRKDDAISPVIGVMLMLVVTIIIAAVVVMFSTGLAGDTKTTPTAMFEVSGMEVVPSGSYGDALTYLNIRHKGGDAISLSELQITLESVGGENNGIIQTLTVSDEKSQMDYTEGTKTVVPDGQKELYDNAKSDLDSQVAEYESLIQSVGEDPANYDWRTNRYGFYNIEFEYDEDYYNATEERLGELVDLMVNNDWMINRIINDLGGEENLEFDANGNLVGGKLNAASAYPVSVLGQTQPTKSTVSAGNIIQVRPHTGHADNVIYPDTTVKWTISYIPTNSIIAKGEFEVIAD